MLEGELIVEFDAGPLAAGPGEGILIAAGERHRAAVPEDCLLLSVEAVGMSEARASRCRHLVLIVTRTNRRARSFYEGHGYAHVADLAGFVRPGIAESLYLKNWRA